ncbi:hypothetical protein CIPAW_04G089100 [Carya illinoinensis]|uniref:Uncharacterized protein n=1 Tax=Carya illinoinensis TaxID=32201 RepID=A0A8T1QTV2_CARIL|nr:hypothetical protein CIPAW_04G089100 [Carya illinoinensis]
MHLPAIDRANYTRGAVLFEQELKYVPIRTTKARLAHEDNRVRLTGEPTLVEPYKPVILARGMEAINNISSTGYETGSHFKINDGQNRSDGNSVECSQQYLERIFGIHY